MNNYQNQNPNNWQQGNQNGYYSPQQQEPLIYQPPKRRNGCLIALIIAIIAIIVVALIAGGIVAFLYYKGQSKEESSSSVSASVSESAENVKTNESSKTSGTSDSETKPLEGDKNLAPEGMTISKTQPIGYATTYRSTIMYTAPDTDSAMIVTIPKKDIELPLWGYNSDWSYVRYVDENNVTYSGYVGNWDITYYVTSEPYIGSLTVKTNKETIDMYLYPSDEDEPYAEITNDTFLCYYGYEHGWYRIVYDGYIGYIKESDVELN